MTTETLEPVIIGEAGLALTATERDDFARCEETIERGRQTFLEVGEALGEIRDRRLYREAFGTFDDYLAARWPSIGNRRTADRFISAAEVARDLRPIGLTLENESQARPLAGLEPEQRHAAMQEAAAVAGDKAPTAAQIAQAAAKHKPAPPAKPAAPAPAAAPPPATALPPALPMAAAAAPAALPPALPGLPPALPGLGAPPATPEVARLKQLAARLALLREALAIVEGEVRALPESAPVVTVPQAVAQQAARIFLAGPALALAESGLVLSATVESDE